MTVRGLDKNKDWKFGNGKDNYFKDEQAIVQNVETRIKSFKNDWFLDSQANIDWLNILGSKENKETIIKEIKRVTLATEGVLRINSIELEETSERSATVSLNFDTIYAQNINTNITV